MEPPRAISFVNLRTMGLSRVILYVNLRTMTLPWANFSIELYGVGGMPRTRYTCEAAKRPSIYIHINIALV